MSAMPLQGRVALVTGGACRTGREIALALAAAGADVVIHYRHSHAEALEAVAEVERLGRRGLALQADLADAEATAAAFASVVERLGRLDILVNNAAGIGCGRGGGSGQPLPRWCKFPHALDCDPRDTWPTARGGDSVLGWWGHSSHHHVVSLAERRGGKSSPRWRASSQQYSAVRAPPMCRNPVGLGAKRVRRVMPKRVWWKRGSLADRAGSP